MREKLNENPVYQAAIIGVLAIVVGFMLLRAMSGPKPGGEQPDLSVGAPATTEPATAPAAPATGGTAPAPAAPTDAAAPAPAPGADADAAPAPAPSGNGKGKEHAGNANPNGSGFVAGPGLPKDVVAAYNHDNVIAMLVVRRPGIDDQRLMPMIAGLYGVKGVAPFIVKAFDIAKYSRIAQGVDIDRTPALVVIEPRRLTEGPLPTATITYGYRDETTIKQQIDDALYRGKEHLPYYP